jgi:hypothetical protein
MSKPRAMKPITQEELQIAIRKFRKQGGIIRKLPDQKSIGQRAVSTKEGHAQAVPDAAP